MSVLTAFETLGAADRDAFAAAANLAETVFPEAEPLGEAGDALVREAAKAAGLFDLAQRPAAEALLTLVVVRERLAASGARCRKAALGPSPGLLQNAGGVLQARFAEPVTQGLRRQAFAYTDDAAAPVRATPGEEGYRLTGRKSFVTGGLAADHFLVYAQSDTGPLMLVVEDSTMGMTRTDPFETLDGGQHCALVFDDAFVPGAHRLGEAGQGKAQAFAQINRTRLMLAAEAVGLMAYAVHRAAEHLQAPRPKGPSLGEQEGPQLRFAELWMPVFTARALLYRVAAQFAGSEGTPEGLAALKVHTSETAERVISRALQLCGAQALRADDPLARSYREVRSWQFAEGASDLLRLSVAKARLAKGRGAL